MRIAKSQTNLKRNEAEKRQRENSSKTDYESTDATFMEDQYGGQQNEDGTMNEEKYADRLNEINMKLDKLLSLCPLVEDLNVQFASLKEENYTVEEIAAVGY